VKPDLGKLFSSPAITSVDAAVVTLYLQSNGIPTSAIQSESERVFEALAQYRPERVGESGGAYAHGDLFAPKQPAAPSEGKRAADAATRALSRNENGRGLGGVSDDLRKGVGGDWEALACELDAKRTANQILPQLVKREIPYWNPVDTRSGSPIPAVDSMPTPETLMNTPKTPESTPSKPTTSPVPPMNSAGFPQERHILRDFKLSPESLAKILVLRSNLSGFPEATNSEK